MIKIPNWATGFIQVKGKPENIEKFCKLFIFEGERSDEPEEKTGKYFARSFVHQSWKDFKKEVLGMNEVDFNVHFAWSCWSCMFEGCVTLEWACKEYDVEVKIETEESGEGFEEEITADKNGANYYNNDIPEHECICGNVQQIPSAYTDKDLEDVECYECERTGKWGTGIKAMVLKKIESEKEKKDADM